MLKSIAGIASRLLLLASTLLDDYASAPAFPLPPRTPDDLDPLDAADPFGVEAIETELFTQEARSMVGTRIPRPPKLPDEPLIGSIEWRARQRDGAV